MAGAEEPLPDETSWRLACRRSPAACRRWLPLWGELLSTRPTSTPTSNVAIATALPSTASAATPTVSPPPVASPTAQGAAPTVVVATPSSQATTSTPGGTASTPSAGFEIAPVFRPAMIGYWAGMMSVEKYNYLGSAVEPARTTKLAEQSFGRYSDGFCGTADSPFLWREDTRQIYFLMVENSGLHMEACRDFWTVYTDTWKAGDPNNEAQGAAGKGGS